MCDRLVSAQVGGRYVCRIRLNDRPNGCRLYLLPVDTNVSIELDVSTTPALLITCSPGGTIGRMILLVEDDAITRMATAQALRSTRQEVLEAGNGVEALRLLADHPGIKLVVMDFVLPGMDGFKLMDLMHERRPKLPIILVSGYLSQRAGDAIVELPGKADKYFAKPFRPSALVKTAQELVGSI